jgi:hypothetical protein
MFAVFLSKDAQYGGDLVRDRSFFLEGHLDRRHNCAVFERSVFLYFSCFSCASLFCLVNHEVYYCFMQQVWAGCCCAARDSPGGIRTVMVGKTAYGAMRAVREKGYELEQRNKYLLLLHVELVPQSTRKAFRRECTFSDFQHPHVSPLSSFGLCCLYFLNK